MAISRREMDVEDYIDIVRRHKSWILGPALACLVVSVVVAFLWPDTYVSTARIKVLPPQIPESLVPVTFQMDMVQRIQQMRQNIVSNANLTNLINTHQLYPRERRRLPMQDVIELMRDKGVSVVILNNTGLPGPQRTVAFQVSFSYENRYLAQKVCSDLVSKFIDENVRERSSIAGQTKDFVDDQWQTRKRELENVEEQMAKFRTANLGRTPEQQGSTLQAITSIETRMSNINGSLARVSQDRLILENNLSILKDQLRQVSTPTVETIAPTMKSDRLITLEREISNMENRLQAMREQYHDNHPDVKNFVSNIQIVKRERDKLQKEQDDLEKANNSADRKSALRPEAAREARGLEAQIGQLQARIEATKLEEDAYKKSQAEAERSARSLQSTLASMPSSEKEYEQLRLQAMLARRDFEEIDRKRQMANAAVELENRKQTEKLEILDSAFLPTNPTEPKRWVIILGGALGGLVLGICLAGAREMKDSSLKNLKDARAYTQLTVLGCIPLLENDLVVRRRRRLAWLAWSTACLASVAIMAGAIFFYYQNK
jgi:polysaccharide chain length determinant protein (PEP-CTERM system associated)